MGGSSKDKRDIYYRKAKAEGYRARSAWKLIHLDELIGFLGQPAKHSYAARFNSGDVRLPPRPDRLKTTTAKAAASDARASRTIVDLCAAPGSWSQVLARAFGHGGNQGHEPAATLLAVDLQSMAPIPRVIQVRADITLPATAAKLRTLAKDDWAELIICDGAPDVHGLHILDEFQHSFLLTAALSIAIRMLRPGGCYIAKIFAHDSRPSLAASATRSLRETRANGPRTRKHLDLDIRRDDHAETDVDERPTYSARILKAQLERFFDAVLIVKPASSRPSSAEHFVICLDFLRTARPASSASDPLRSSLWDTTQGRDSIAACLLQANALPVDDSIDQAERTKRIALHALTRFAAEGDLRTKQNLST